MEDWERGKREKGREWKHPYIGISRQNNHVKYLKNIQEKTDI